MKRIITLTLALCLLCAAALAETATLTRVDFGGFSLELDEQYLTVGNKVNNQVFAQYVPPMEGGMITANLNIVWAQDGTEAELEPDALAAYGETLTTQLGSALSAQGMTVKSCEVLNTGVEDVEGKRVGAIVILTTLDLSAYGLGEISMYTYQIMFTTEQGGYVITMTFENEADFAVFAPILESLQWT